MMMPPAALPCREQAAWGTRFASLPSSPATTSDLMPTFSAALVSLFFALQPLRTSPVMVQILGTLLLLQA